MGRPRQKHKDLPRGLYKDAAGRFYLKAFDEEGKRRLGGKTSIAVGKDPAAARTRWAEVFGFRDHEPASHGTVAEVIERFIDEDLVRIIKVKGEIRPKYAPRTQKEYKRILGKWARSHGAQRYARSEAEASLGGFFRTMDVSQHLRAMEEAGKGPQGNRNAAALSSAFRYAKECGLTEYNPCLGASRNTEEPRDQDLADALFLELYQAASPVLQCLMDLNIMVSSRLGNLLRITEFDWSEKGLMVVPAKRKRGQAKRKQLFKRTEDLAEVMGRAFAIKAETLARDRDKPGHKLVKSTYIFVSGPDGEPYSDSGAQSMIRRCKERVARARLVAAGVEKPTDEQLLEVTRALDTHFHDGRARGADEAEKRGENVADFLGNTEGTARRHYLNRRASEHTPNAKIRSAK